MKKFCVLIIIFLIGLEVWAQYDITDTVNITGVIIKIELLQKDWSKGGKVKQIYWVEITIQPYSNQVLPHGMTLPKSVSFRSGSSGYWSHLDHFRMFKVNDVVAVTVVSEYLRQFINKDRENILIDKIKKLN
jgi:hypothetical protein